MKLDGVKLTDTNIDNIETYTIEANPIIFKMLSSDIYMNKIAAVIRELSTNAIDAMVEAGTLIPGDLENSKKYKVHLPTTLESYFSIRDYGTGLDEAGIKRVFTYGASSRRGNNIGIGVLGLGAKSPHAYNKTSFNVFSYIDGKCYSYIALMKDGVPGHVPNGVEDTDEPNGVEIVINVNYKDIEEFKLEAQNIYFWFEHKPETNLELDFKKFRKTLECEKYIAVTARESAYSERKIHGCLMGNILYQYPSNFFNSMSVDMKANLQKVVLKLNIGDLDIHPSREFLDDSDKTKKAVQALYDGLEKYMEGQFVERMKLLSDEPITLFEKNIKYNNLLSDTSFQTHKSLFTLAKKIDKRFHAYSNRISNFQRFKKKTGCTNTTRRKFSVEDKSTVLRIDKLMVVCDRPIPNLSIFNEIDALKGVENQGVIFNLITPNYEEFRDPVNKRVDYETCKTVVEKRLLKYIRCDKSHLTFVSDLIEKFKANKASLPKVPRTVAPKDKTKKFVPVTQYRKDSITDCITIDIMNITDPTYYAYANNKFDRALVNSGVCMDRKIAEYLIGALSILGINITTLTVFYKTTTKPELLCQPNLIEVETLLKSRFADLKFISQNCYVDVYENTAKFYKLNEEMLNKVTFKSKFMNLVRGCDGFIKYCSGLSNSELYSFFKRNTWFGKPLEVVDPTLTPILEYIKKYTLKNGYTVTGKIRSLFSYRDSAKDLDEWYAILEYYYDAHPEELKEYLDVKPALTSDIITPQSEMSIGDDVECDDDNDCDEDELIPISDIKDEPIRAQEGQEVNEMVNCSE